MRSVMKSSVISNKVKARNAVKSMICAGKNSNPNRRALEHLLNKKKLPAAPIKSTATIPTSHSYGNFIRSEPKVTVNLEQYGQFNLSSWVGDNGCDVFGNNVFGGSLKNPSLDTPHIDGRNPFSVIISPNPTTTDTIKVQFTMPYTTSVGYFISTIDGKVVEEGDIEDLQGGITSINFNIAAADTELVFITFVFDEKYYRTEKVMRK
jgi:hypothetical protein